MAGELGACTCDTLPSDAEQLRISTSSFLTTLSGLAAGDGPVHDIDFQVKVSSEHNSYTYMARAWNSRRRCMVGTWYFEDVKTYCMYMFAPLLA